MNYRMMLAGLMSVVTLAATPVALAATSVNLDDLLNQVRQGRAQDSAENAERIRKFESDKARQRQLLTEIGNDRKNEEARSLSLEREFEENDVKVIEMEDALRARLGDLKELFGVVQQASGDARGLFENSVTQVQFAGRTDFLTELAQKLGQTNRLASMEDLEMLWFELQREMTESGKVVRFPATVVTASGNQEQRDVTRIGVFNVVSDGKYLQYVPETGALVEMGRQPQSRYTNRLQAVETNTAGFNAFGLDPTRGQLLGLLVEAPNVRERIDQGGLVGYIIIGLGVLALLVAIERLITLSIVGAKISSQVKNPDKPANNPLGRILKVFHDNRKAELETLELKLGEAIMKETPKLSRLLTFLKIIAVVAPLLGLLGTVTGMIITFQQITLFGTGDPKLMAGGISQALVTTMLGLCVAIPTVFLHTIVAGRAKRLTQVLQEEAAGMVAEQAEGRGAAA